MIEKAFVSGQIAKSVFIEEDRVFLLDAATTENPLECTVHDRSLFFNSGAEINTYEDITIAELREKLLKEKSCFDALYGAIGGFDAILSEETRILSIERAEKLVKNPEIMDFVKSRLFGNPVPGEAGLKDAVKLSRRNHFTDMNSIYTMLFEHKEVLHYILGLFNEKILKLSLHPELIKIKNVFITGGIFSELFQAVAGEDQKELNNLVYRFSIDQEIREKILAIPDILTRMKADIEGKYNLAGKHVRRG